MTKQASIKKNITPLRGETIPTIVERSLSSPPAPPLAEPPLADRRPLDGCAVLRPTCPGQRSVAAPRARLRPYPGGLRARHVGTPCFCYMPCVCIVFFLLIDACFVTQHPPHATGKMLLQCVNSCSPVLGSIEVRHGGAPCRLPMTWPSGLLFRCSSCRRGRTTSC